MDIDKLVYEFMELAREDPSIGPSHISLYLAIVYAYQQRNRQMPIQVRARQLMDQSKIRSTCTFYKYLQTLIDKRYISYRSSFAPGNGSFIVINEKLG